MMDGLVQASLYLLDAATRLGLAEEERPEERVDLRAVFVAVAALLDGGGDLVVIVVAGASSKPSSFVSFSFASSRTRSSV